MDIDTVLLKISCKNGLIGKFTVDMIVRLEETWIDVVSKPPIREKLTEIMKDQKILTSLCGIHSSSKTFGWPDTVGGSIQRNYATLKWELNVCIRKRKDRKLSQVLGTPGNGQGQGGGVEVQNNLGEEDTLDEAENSELQIDSVTGSSTARQIIVTLEGSRVVKMEDVASDVEVGTEDTGLELPSDFEMSDNYRGLSPTPTEATSFFHDNIDHEMCEHLKEKFNGMSNEQIQYLIDGCKGFIGGNINRQMKNDSRHPQLATFLRALFNENGSGGSLLYDDQTF